MQKINYAINWLSTNLTTVSNLISTASAANKLNTNNGTAYGLTIGDATASRAAAIGATGNLTNATTTLAELNQLSGVSGGVQTNLDGRLPGTYLLPTGDSTDRATAINAALANRGTVYLLGGNFYVASPIYLTNNSILRGMGKSVSTGQGTVILRNFSGTNETINVNGQYASIENLTLNIGAAAYTNGVGILATNFSRGSFKSLSAFAHKHGYALANSYNNQFSDIHCYNLSGCGLVLGMDGSSVAENDFLSGQLNGYVGSIQSGSYGIWSGPRTAGNRFKLDVESFTTSVHDEGSENDLAGIYTETVGTSAFDGAANVLFARRFHDATRSVDFSTVTNLIPPYRGRGMGPSFDWQNQIIIPQPLAEYDFAFTNTVAGAGIQSLWPGSYDISWAGTITNGSDGLMGRKYVQAQYPSNYLLPPTNLFDVASGPRTFIFCVQTVSTTGGNNNLVMWGNSTGSFADRHGIVVDGAGSGVRRVRTTIGADIYNLNQSGGRVSDSRWTWVAVVLNGSANTAKLLDPVTGLISGSWTNAAIGVNGTRMPYRPSGTLTVRYSYLGVWDSELTQQQVDQVINEKEMGTLKYDQEFSRQARRSTNAAEFASMAGLQTYFSGIPDDGLSDDLALTNSLAAASEIVFKKGTYNFSTNLTTGTTKKIRLEAGAILKPASGIILTIGGDFEGPEQQCVDESAGGHVIFSATSRAKLINSLWWGADNTGNTDATSALQKWAYSGAAGLQTPHYLAAGAGYLVTDEIILSNRVVIVGAGSSGSGGSTILCRPGANQAVFVGAPGANSIKISKILFSASSTAGTNSSAIRFGNSSNNHTWIYDCAFDGFRGFAIYSAGNSLYTKILQNRFLNCRNTAATSGNGLRPSGAIFSTNVFSATTIGWNTVSSSDMAYLFDGGSTTNSGNISVVWDAIEGNGGIGALGTNVIAGNGISELTLIDTHLEHNTNQNLVYLANSKMLNARDGLYSGDYGGLVMATNGFFLDAVEVMNIATRLSHFQSNFVYNTSSSIPVHLAGARFDLGGPSISDASAAAYISGAYELNDRLLTLATGTASVNDDAYDATTWNGSTNVPTKNAVRDKIEALILGGGGDGTGNWTASGSTNSTLTGNLSSNGGIFTNALTLGGNTVATSANKLSYFAATTSSELAGVLSDETGSGASVFAISPALVTPTLGVATATTINKVTLTAPASGSTLTIADGKTLTASASLTLAGTDSTTLTFQGTDTYVGRATTDTLTNKRITRRVEALTDAATVTPSSASYDFGKLTTLSQNTTIANPSGTPTDAQQYQLRIKSTAARTLTFGSQFRGSTDLALPASTSGSSLTDYLGFQWNAADSKWDLVAKNFGF